MIPREILRKVRQIEIRTNREVTDVLGGQYHSVFKGHGMEFEEVREYLPGDEVRSIDWNVTARLGHPFVKKFRDEYKDAPGYRAEAGYVAGRVLARALENTGGNPGTGMKLVEALRAVKISDAPRGPISFDEYGGVVQNIYIRRVDRIGKELQNTVIATLPNVSQFWTYDPKAYMSKPAYSRDYPPCTHCQ